MNSETDRPPFDGRRFARTLTSRPGVYRMLAADGQVLYVGKASNLRNRVGSYFTRGMLQPRIAAMVAQICEIEVSITRTAAEALLLEDQLIKSLKPRYNVMLRDDKSYPHIYLSAHAFPRLAFHRGPQRESGQYFGPYPSAYSVRDSLKLMQKLFRVRQCEDTFFSNRSRPCLQYQIQRCTAPCVAAIEPEDYARDVRHATLFLEGRSQQVIDELAQQMQCASDRLAFEEAAQLRDQIATLQKIQAQQFVLGAKGDLDIVALAGIGNAACVAVFFFRKGRNLGNRSFFPRNVVDATAADVLQAFLSQFYVDKELPPELVVSDSLVDAELLADAFSERAGRQVRIIHQPRGDKLKWLRMARENAKAALQTRMAGHAGMRKRLQSLTELLGLDELPNRIECFDISHTQGEATVASCVVFDAEGPRKSDYRRFNIKHIGDEIKGGDDYAAMHQALERRYSRLKTGEGKLPDLLLIDGGKGQVAQAMEVLEELQLDQLKVVGVAKGPSRKVGGETLIVGGTNTEFSPQSDSPGFQLIHHIRDEAHRFAITGHRARRAKARQSSSLERIPGIGAARRKALLGRFGGIQGVKSAGVEELSRVPGISQALAQRIYDVLHA